MNLFDEHYTLKGWLEKQSRWLQVWLLNDLSQRDAECCGIGHWRLTLKRKAKLSKKFRHNRRQRDC